MSTSKSVPYTPRPDGALNLSPSSFLLRDKISPSAEHQPAHISFAEAAAAAVHIEPNDVFDQLRGTYPGFAEILAEDFEVTYGFVLAKFSGYDRNVFMVQFQDLVQNGPYNEDGKPKPVVKTLCYVFGFNGDIKELFPELANLRDGQPHEEKAAKAHGGRGKSRKAFNEYPLIRQSPELEAIMIECGLGSRIAIIDYLQRKGSPPGTAKVETWRLLNGHVSGRAGAISRIAELIAEKCGMSAEKLFADQIKPAEKQKKKKATAKQEGRRTGKPRKALDAYPLFSSNPGLAEKFGAAGLTSHTAIAAFLETEGIKKDPAGTATHRFLKGFITGQALGGLSIAAVLTARKCGELPEQLFVAQWHRVAERAAAAVKKPSAPHKSLSDYSLFQQSPDLLPGFEAVGLGSRAAILDFLIQEKNLEDGTARSIARDLLKGSIIGKRLQFTRAAKLVAEKFGLPPEELFASQWGPVALQRKRAFENSLLFQASPQLIPKFLKAGLGSDTAIAAFLESKGLRGPAARAAAATLLQGDVEGKPSGTVSQPAIWIAGKCGESAYGLFSDQLKLASDLRQALQDAKEAVLRRFRERRNASAVSQVRAEEKTTATPPPAAAQAFSSRGATIARPKLNGGIITESATTIQAAQKLGLFHDVDALDLRFILANAFIKRHEKVQGDETVILQQDTPHTNFMLVLRGRVAYCENSPSGDRRILQFYGPGDFLLDPFEHKVDEYHYFAGFGESELLNIPRPNILEALRLVPALHENMQRAILTRNQKLMEHASMLHGQFAGEKLAQFLLCYKFEQERGGDRLLPSRQAIGDYINLTIESTSREFTSFRDQGLISMITPKEVVIADIETLCEIAGYGSEEEARIRLGYADMRANWARGASETTGTGASAGSSAHRPAWGRDGVRESQPVQQSRRYEKW